MTHPQDTPANPAQGVREALSDCLDMLARFTHSTSNDLNHVEARAVYRAGRAALAAIDTAPKTPGWPDPLESPQAEALRNGKVDDTEIRNLFDCMERELRLHRERAANPAKVMDARYDNVALETAREIVKLVQRGGDDHLKAKIQVKIIEAITAAIGAGVATGPISETAPVLPTWGGQAVAWQRYNERSDSWSQVDPDYAQTLAAGGETVRPLFTHPAPSGQAVAWQRRKLYEPTEQLWEQRTEAEATGHFDRHPGYEYRPVFANPPAQPGVVMLPADEAEAICKRLEYDASWDKCGHGYYRLKSALRDAPLPGDSK